MIQRFWNLSWYGVVGRNGLDNECGVGGVTREPSEEHVERVVRLLILHSGVLLPGGVSFELLGADTTLDAGDLIVVVHATEQATPALCAAPLDCSILRCSVVEGLRDGGLVEVEAPFDFDRVR